MKSARRERREIALKKREIMPAIVRGPNSQAWHPDRAIAAAIRKEKSNNARRKRNSHRFRGDRFAA